MLMFHEFHAYPNNLQQNNVGKFITALFWKYKFGFELVQKQCYQFNERNKIKTVAL